MTSGVSWPDELAKQAANRNILLIIGAGISASSSLPDGSHPPNWTNLLLDLATKLSVGKVPEFEKLIKEGRLLDAASLLKWLAKQASKEQDFFSGLREAVDGMPATPFPGSPWHEAILRLDPDVIYTTNFDRILERASKDGFDPHLFDSMHVGREVRRKSAIIVKIHGSISHIEDIVLTRQDFARVRIKGSHALEVLRALLTTRCALLLGYSLGDPDIQLLFENVLDGRDETPAHYLYTEDSLPEYEREVLRANYGVVPITYAAGRYDLGLAGLNELADQVEAMSATP